MMMINIRSIASKCSRWLLLILNALCILVALGTFALAVVDARILKQYGEEQAAGTLAGDIIIMMACLLLMLVATFGCVGVLRNHVKILYLYVGFLMILVILELMIGIFVSVQRYGLEFRVTEWLREDFFGNATDEAWPDHQARWDRLQTSYECCGLNGPDDYPALSVPISLSCCPRAYRARNDYAQQHLYKACIDKAEYFSAGCEEEILSALREGVDSLLGIAIICFWFETAGMLLAMSVANNQKNSVKLYEETVRY